MHRISLQCFNVNFNLKDKNSKCTGQQLDQLLACKAWVLKDSTVQKLVRFQRRI
jgi:hypothetical protein